MSNFQSSLCSFLWEISTTLPRTRWLCDLWKMKFKTKVFILTHILLRKKGNLNHWIPLTSIHWSLYISALPLEMVKNLCPPHLNQPMAIPFGFGFFFPLCGFPFLVNCCSSLLLFLLPLFFGFTSSSYCPCLFLSSLFLLPFQLGGALIQLTHCLALESLRFRTE